VPAFVAMGLLAFPSAVDVLTRVRLVYTLHYSGPRSSSVREMLLRYLWYEWYVRPICVTIASPDVVPSCVVTYF
jgi:hypothetical protein